MTSVEQRYAEAIERNRLVEAEAVCLSLPPHHQMDAAHIASIEDEINSGSSDGWEIRLATADLWQQIPRDRGIYMFCWRPPLSFKTARNGRQFDFRYVLYVGQAGADGTGNLKERYRREYGQIVHSDPDVHWRNAHPADRRGKLGRFLNLHVLEYWFRVFRVGADLRKIENELITLHNPPANTQLARHQAKIGPTRRAF